jgi:DNA polymerase-3 subunit alpha
VVKKLDINSVTPEELLWQWLRFGWEFRGMNKRSKEMQKFYSDNVKKEMKLIVSKDFISYFLMLSDIIRYAKREDILVGPGRGSSAASYVCWLLRITEVDPQPYPAMVFERFIDETRNDLPDIDVDFDDELRWRIQAYIEEKYGSDHVGNVGTYTRYRGKNALDDVAWVHRIPKWEIDKVKDLIVERSGGDARFDASLEDTVEMFPQAKEVFERNPDLYKAFELEGNLKGFGIHAAGIVVGAEPLNGYVATYARLDPKSKRMRQVLSVDKSDGEHLGMLKLDALGLSTMGMLRHALEISGLKADDLYNIPMDDGPTNLAFHNADVTGIFQFEGRALRQTTEQMKPNNFDDLAAINALSRPGPLHSGTTGDYLSVREGRIPREDLHPLITEITKATEGQIIYQEQILRICTEIAEFPWTGRVIAARVDVPGLPVNFVIG